ncbi:hypothetical protein D030_3039A, partial [Vibrio parahaemolyticus AQ3810]
MVFTSRHNV